MKKKVALVFPYAEPETGAPIARIKFFKSVLQNAGYSVITIAPQKRGVKEKQGVIRYHNKSGLFSILKQEKPSLAIVSGPPATIVFETAVFCKILGIPVIADARDPWVESKLALGLLKKGSFRHSIQKWIEKTAYSLCRKTLVVSPAVKKSLERIGVNGKKIAVIEHSVDLSVFREDKKEAEKTKKKLKIGKKPVLIYVGGPWVGLAKFIEETAESLCEKDIFLLLILSKSPADPPKMFKEIQKAIEKNALAKNSTVLFNVPHEELYKYLSMAKAGLNIIPEGLLYVISNKVKEYIACGVPVFCKCDKRCYAKKIIEKKRIGFAATTWQEFREKINKFMENEELEKLKKAALETARDYSYEKIGKKFLREVKKVIAE